MPGGAGSPSDRYEALAVGVALQLVNCVGSASLAPQLVKCGSASLALQLVYGGAGAAGAGAGATGRSAVQSWSRISPRVGRCAGEICSIWLSRSISLASDGAGTEVRGAATVGSGAGAAAAGLDSVGTVATICAENRGSPS